MAVSWLSIPCRYIMPGTVDRADWASEWLRLSEHYRRMSDGELLLIARDPSALTHAAQQVLAGELSVRRLEVPPPEAPVRLSTPEPQPDSPYAEERELVEICQVWSLSDALQLQWLLDRAGIPFFIGTENATSVDSVKSNFAEGVSVKVMRVGVPWAWQAMTNYEPANEPLPEKEEEGKEIPVVCPKCRSTDVIFERLKKESQTVADTPDPKFEWTCDSCGYQWEDEGVARER
jgi:DNA-directed RNA polymerase subunit M/transcription elongation factor TFIIS